MCDRVTESPFEIVVLSVVKHKNSVQNKPNSKPEFDWGTNCLISPCPNATGLGYCLVRQISRFPNRRHSVI